jgi:hypothetical protein
MEKSFEKSYQRIHPYGRRCLLCDQGRRLGESIPERTHPMCKTKGKPQGASLERVHARSIPQCRQRQAQPPHRLNMRGDPFFASCSLGIILGFHSFSFVHFSMRGNLQPPSACRMLNGGDRPEWKKTTHTSDSNRRASTTAVGIYGRRVHPSFFPSCCETYCCEDRTIQNLSCNGPCHAVITAIIVMVGFVFTHPPTLI